MNPDTQKDLAEQVADILKNLANTHKMSDEEKYQHIEVFMEDQRYIELEDNDKEAVIEMAKHLLKMGVIKKNAKELQILTQIEQGLVVNNVQRNVEILFEVQPFFYNSSRFFFFWNLQKLCWEEVDEVDVMNCIDTKLKLTGQTTKGHIKSEYLETIKRVGRLHAPKDCPPNFIQFKDKVCDINTGKVFLATPEYFYRNPIPHDIGKSTATPVIDRLITDWVGEKYLSTVKEIIAYCTYNGYPLHVITVFTGNGSNGKSTLIKLMYRFIGKENVVGTSLHSLVENRFETYSLWGKKIAAMGETDFGVMEKTDLIKKLSGEDMIKYEAKNKDGFSDINTAKLIVSSNSLPQSTDNSDGFHRRWLIIEFDKQFPLASDVLAQIPDEEYDNLGAYCINVLPELLKRGEFSNHGTIQQRREKYVLVSNPLPIFIKKFCEVSPNDWVSASQIFTLYVQVLNHNKRRIVNRKEFNKNMAEEGFEYSRIHKTTYGEDFNGFAYLGLRLRPDWQLLDKSLRNESENAGKENEIVTDVINVTGFQTSSLRRGVVSNVVTTVTNITETPDIVDKDILVSKLVSAFGELDFLTKEELIELIGDQVFTSARFQGLIMETKPDVWKLAGGN